MKTLNRRGLFRGASAVAVAAVVPARLAAAPVGMCLCGVVDCGIAKGLTAGLRDYDTTRGLSYTGFQGLERSMPAMYAPWVLTSWRRI